MPGYILASIFHISQPQIITKVKKETIGQFVAGLKIEPGVEVLKPVVILPKAADPRTFSADAIRKIRPQTTTELARTGRIMVKDIDGNFEIIATDTETTPPGNFAPLPTYPSPYCRLRLRPASAPNSYL
jgi:hypothetical protein